MASHTVNEKSALLPYLFKHFAQFNKTKIRQLLKYGSVTVNGHIVTAHDKALKPGDQIDFLTKKSASKERLKRGLDFPIVYEDAVIAVIEKPSGLLAMGTEKDKIHTAYYALTAYVRAQSPTGRGRVFIVHRLDREASGLMVFAKTLEAKVALQENWGHAVKKYFAVVEGAPEKAEDTIESHLIEDKFRRVYSTTERSRESKYAATRYRILKSGRFSLLEVTLVTGRKNQIRVHLSESGHPIIGDAKYGSVSDPAGRLGLHACYLAFQHPETGKKLVFESPLPEPLAKITRSS